MRTDVWQPNWIEAVDALAGAEEFNAGEATALKSAYDLLRRCESILRRHDNIGISTLPAEAELSRLSRRLEFKSDTDFNRAYETARQTIHEIYVRRFGKDRVTAGGKASSALAKQKG